MMSIISLINKILFSLLFVVFGYFGILAFINAVEQTTPNIQQYACSIFFIVAAVYSVADMWRFLIKKPKPE
jgi:ABC-type Na+ efflux pump permease subunit